MSQPFSGHYHEDAQPEVSAMTIADKGESSELQRLRHDVLFWINQVGIEQEKLKLESARLDWLDKHCSFVADSEYKIGPFKVGELRNLADAGISVDKNLKAEGRA